MTRSRALMHCALGLMAAVPLPVRAQWGVWTGDSLLAAGRLIAAESAYYATARSNPRDPVARAALGRFLAARGATRVGAVLLEEARTFGGDSTSIARALMPLYEQLGDFAAIAALKPNLLSGPARRRANWLADKPPEFTLRDSVVVLTYRPMVDGRGIATILIRTASAGEKGAAKNEIPAVLDPRVSGLIVPRAMGSQLRSFGKEGDATLAVTETLRVGGATFSNVPTSVMGPDEPVRIGFDVLAPMSPTFDPVRGVMILRRPARRGIPPTGTRVPALFDSNGVRILLGGRWLPWSNGSVAMLLSSRAWTWDARRADVVLLNR